MDYSFAWKLETICPAIKLYFQWMCHVSTFRSDDSWSGNEIHTAISINCSINLVIDYFNNRLIVAALERVSIFFIYVAWNHNVNLVFVVCTCRTLRSSGLRYIAMDTFAANIYLERLWVDEQNNCFWAIICQILPCDAMRCTVLVIVILSVRPSVCPSVCHTRGLCPHGSTYDHDFFTIW